ncbi:hypothetical protein [Tenacibaculum xiamenense]|uniref:hypothetical protein n=1 Tax=Tenacibaculum xiamenense TaxID=1261553 RepID=UPI003893E28D
MSKNTKWDFKIIETGSPNNDKVANFINTLTSEQRKTYKVVQDDRRSENAHAVIFFDKAEVICDSSNQPVASYKFTSKGTNKGGLQSACQEAVAWLNNLDDIQAVNARATMSNSKNPTEILSFFYPNLS